ncbi:Zinc finger, CHCC-type [Burkholderiales bacterium]|jgi:uncharacterized Zn-finger protein
MSDLQHTSDAVVLQAHELPAACPNPRMPLWSSHPKVYLDLAHGSAKCPYCGTEYTLAEGVSASGH